MFFPKDDEKDFDYENRGTLEGGTYIQALSGTELRVFGQKVLIWGLLILERIIGNSCIGKRLYRGNCFC